jgi:hypothetical protein
VKPILSIYSIYDESKNKFSSIPFLIVNVIHIGKKTLHL